MYSLALRQEFDWLITWHSFFHLFQENQRAMFPTFTAHLKAGRILLFTSGEMAQEIGRDNGAENLYHASLDEYKDLLKQ